ncbi:MAG: ribonuclease HII [Aggregatilineales bacterium]
MHSSALKTASLTLERDLRARGISTIIGLDEAGRGAWAGPVVAGAACLPLERDDLLALLSGVYDSKQLTPQRRAHLANRIIRVAAAWGMGIASNVEIDALGIVPATRLAMERALASAMVAAPSMQPSYLLLDAIHWPQLALPHRALIRGDQQSLSIAAASVLAKVYRDQMMVDLDRHYPNYGFAAHKGYGTAAHRAALAAYGMTPAHRASFAPLRAFSAKAE